MAAHYPCFWNLPLLLDVPLRGGWSWEDRLYYIIAYLSAVLWYSRPMIEYDGICRIVLDPVYLRLYGKRRRAAKCRRHGSRQSLLGFWLLVFIFLATDPYLLGQE